MIHGIKKDGNISDEEWFKSFCETNLKVSPKIEKGNIKKAKAGHYIGIFTLKSPAEKAKIFRNCSKLKDSIWKISIRDDLYETKGVKSVKRNVTSMAHKLKKELNESNQAMDYACNATKAGLFSIQNRRLLNRTTFNTIIGLHRQDRTAIAVDSDDEEIV